MIDEITTLFNCAPKDSWSDCHCDIICGHFVLLFEVDEFGEKFEEELDCVVV